MPPLCVDKPIMRDTAKVKRGRLYEKTNAKGTRYFVGRLGTARVLLFPSREIADGGDPVWDLYLQEVEDTRPRPVASEMPARRPTRAQPERPADDGESVPDDPLDDVLPSGR